MGNKRTCLFCILALFFFILLFYPAQAAGTEIYIQGRDVTAGLTPVIIEGQVLVKARSLAAEIGAGIRWIDSINTLKFTGNNNTVIKMMLDSPYLQIGERTVKSKTGLIMRNNHTYVPLKEVAAGFGYLTNHEGEKIYVYKPESFVNQVRWRNDKRQLVIELSKIAPYRINENDDPHKLIIEIDRASLAADFTDDVSGKNYYLEVNRSRKTARLQLILTGKFPLPFYSESFLEEEGDNLVLNFFPQLQAIEWKQEALSISASGRLKKPEINVLNDPRRMVLDFPDLRLGDYDFSLADNQWIKDVRVSQFKFEPLVLRIVLELEEDKYMTAGGRNKTGDKYVVKPAVKTEIGNLEYNNNRLSFTSSAPVEPDLFTLKDPERLVINIYNALRSSDFNDRIKVDDDPVKGVRAARFDENVVRIVADLVRPTAYHLRRTKLQEGYRYDVLFGSGLRKFKIAADEGTTGITIQFDEEIEYEVKRFTHPARLAIDVKNRDLDPDKTDLPQPGGLINNIKLNKYNNQGVRYTRFVFRLDNYYGYNILSPEKGKIISVNLPHSKREPEKSEGGNVIIIDAGHGGFDPGASGPSGLKEKKVNLTMARQVSERLRDRGYKVVMTRKTDDFISLRERVEIANESDAALFVSIHNNSSGKKYSEGTETFLAEEGTADSLLLAEIIQSELIAELGLVDRGVKRENFYVIKYTEIPSVLVEVAFLSNPHEESLLGNELFRKRAAGAIVRGICEYLGRKEG